MYFRISGPTGPREANPKIIFLSQFLQLFLLQNIHDCFLGLVVTGNAIHQLYYWFLVYLNPPIHKPHWTVLYIYKQL
jgi:hypothetical protein